MGKALPCSKITYAQAQLVCHFFQPDVLDRVKRHDQTAHEKSASYIRFLVFTLQFSLSSMQGQLQVLMMQDTGYLSSYFQERKVHKNQLPITQFELRVVSNLRIETYR